MTPFILPLAFSPEIAARLRREQQQLAQALEQKGLADETLINRLRAALSEALDSQPATGPGYLDRLRDDARVRPVYLHLNAHDEADELLNLPWHLLAEGCPNLFISKGLPLRGQQDLAEYAPDLPLPLKVLVMVAAPDHSGAGRLDYEAEEKIMLDALSPLVRSGEVELSFTDDGSLASLQRSLAENRYHVLYFSGHSSYGARNPGEAPEATLLLEDEYSMAAAPTSAADFAAVLAADESRRPGLVLLSSCQSAQGGTEGGFRGVAYRLMQAGVPAVIAMGWSVTDFWATHFAGAFFAALAARDTLGQAFNKALEAGRKPFEPSLPAVFFASQSLIPQLFFTQKVSKLVHWDSKSEKRLSRAGENLLKGNDQLAKKLKKVNAVFGREGNDLLFIGRRRERKEALRQLREGRSVLLRGQGGMGKTALALHLAWRHLVADPDGCVPLAFDQTSLSLENLCNALLDFLEVDARMRTIRTQAAAIDKQWDKFFLLLENFEKQGVKPFFIFDNLESFQPDEDPGGPLRADIAELLDYMLTRLGYPVLCTGRYPLKQFDAETLHETDLNEAPAGDFRHKCHHLPALRRLEVKGRNFDQIANTLHRALGGNYRALEFFDELCREAPGGAPGTLEELDALIARRSGETLHHMAGDLVFGRLLGLLNPRELHALLLLAGFRRPVLPFALEWQDAALEPAEPLLARCADLTLAERRAGEAEGRTYYFAPPLVRELLAREALPRPVLDDERAGAYYEKMDKDLNKKNYADLEEAFWHYERMGKVEKVNETGVTLTNFYYNVQAFPVAYDFAQRAEALAGEGTDYRILINLGLILQLYGRLSDALQFLERSLAAAKQSGDRKGEGTTLNNISQIYDAKGDYDTALRYLEQSLRIMQEIGDRKGEGTTLNNLATTAHAKGDYDTASWYLEQSLRIMQEIGDRQGESVTLNNLSQIAQVKGDYDTALKYSEQDLKICQEIGDRKGEGTTLNNFATIAHAKGDYDTALRYLEQSLRIRQEIGDRKGEGMTLNNISQIYDAKGDYDTALRYLEQSLRIQQEIGDRKGVGTTLNNISQIYDAKGTTTRPCGTWSKVCA
ncbi:MAG: tetratricopeptide repeat protein [Saprospiraceae bacterium]